MREIKFRAWDKKNTQMLKSSEIGNLMFSYGENYDHITKYEAEIMQYTGLKDKNGKEIYEGDICKWFSGLNDAGKVGQIVWLDTEMGWRFKENYIDYPPCIYLNVEVIGNIYENPALLLNNTSKI